MTVIREICHIYKLLGTIIVSLTLKARDTIPALVVWTSHLGSLPAWGAVALAGFQNQFYAPVLFISVQGLITLPIFFLLGNLCPFWVI